MLEWIAGFFGRKSSQVELQIAPLDEDWVKAEIERIEAEEERKHWLFVVGLASELFPGDNKAVDRVEEAIKNVLAKISDS